jgi:FkbM family methyltransferase
MDSGGKILRVLGGTYEPEQTGLFTRWVRPGNTVLDVGAHTGYYSLLAARLVGPSGAVWSFEPDPVNFSFLQRHVALNRVREVHLENAAVSDRQGTEPFERGSGTGTGHLGGDGKLRVKTTSVDEFCAARDLRVSAMKIDVEGAEELVLRGAQTTLARDMPVLFLSTHGADVHQKCVLLLQSMGYVLRPIVGTGIATSAELLAVSKEDGWPE